jgi:uronate dehydrogenase
MQRILITGAAGQIGKALREGFRGSYPLIRLLDVAPLDAAAGGEEVIAADIRDIAAMERATAGIDCVVHLAGQSAEAGWDKVLPLNIEGCYNVFEAARKSGVKRIIFASSNHAIGFHRRERFIDDTVVPRPDTRYGVSKVFGEALGSLYADKYGMEVFMIRIGNVNPAPIDKRRLSIWCSPRDLAQLVSIGVDKPGIKFEIVYGISGNKRAWYDNSNAYRLGYKPQDDAESYAEEVLKKEKPGDPTAELYQGGIFVVAEEVPNPAAPRRKKRK